MENKLGFGLRIQLAELCDSFLGFLRRACSQVDLADVALNEPFAGFEAEPAIEARDEDNLD